MIITTTMHIENKPVQEYKGIVFGEVVEGRNFVKDFMSGIRDASFKCFKELCLLYQIFCLSALYLSVR